MTNILSRKDIYLLVTGAILSAVSCVFYSSSGFEGNGSTPITMAISALYVLLSQFLSLEQQLYLVALALPNTKALGFGGISCSIVICAISEFRYCFFSKNKPPIPFGVILYLLYCIQFYVRFEDIMISVVMPIKQVMNMLFFIVLASNKRIFANSFQIGVKSSLFLFAGIVSAFFFSSFARISMGRMAIVGNDPNILAVEVAFTFSYVCLAYVKLKNMSQTVFGIMFVALLLVCALCGSRMGFLLFGFIIIVTIAMNAKSFGKVTGMFLPVVMAAGVFLASNFGQEIIESVQYRMELLETNDNMSNGRFETWDLYLSVLNSSPYMWLFGMGDYTQYGIENQAHNFFIEDLSGYGIIGLLILYPTYFAIYRRLYKNAVIYGGKPNNGIYRFLPLFVPLIGGLTLHGLVSIMNTTMLFLGIMALTKIPEPNRLKKFGV